MPLVCDVISQDKLSILNSQVLKLSDDHPLRRECVDGNVAVFEQNGILVLHSAGGFYFERDESHSIEVALERHIHRPRNYHCTAFEVDNDDPSVVYKLLDRFQEQHGISMRNQIDWCVIQFNGKQLMLVKLPACILRHMLAPSGGLMKTGYKGPIDTLSKIPTLAKLGILSNDFIVDGRVASMLVTEYKPEHYVAVKRLHWDIVREVIARPHSGIALGPVAVWDS